MHRQTGIDSREGAFAVIVVLAFIVLLTGLAIAYYSRTTSDRQVAHSSFNQSKVDQLAASAMETIIGDLRQEIINGSTATVLANGTTLYTPSSTRNIVPTQSPTPAAASTPAILNLIRRSVRSDAIPPPALGSRASAVNSTTDASANGRSITLARWNSHYLIPKSNRLDDKSDPVTTSFIAPNYWAPDWVFLTNQGATIITSPNNAVIGRYAYGIYDEGSLVDLNTAGYPTGSSIYQYGRKGSLAFADLTAPSPYPIPNPTTDSPPVYQVDRLVGWRNYGTAQPSNAFPDTTPSQAFAKNFQTSTASSTYFYNFVVNNTTGFLNVRSDPTPTPYPWNYLKVTGDSSPAAYPWNGRTDQMFLGRQQLLAFRSTTQFSSNALEYVGTFSREAAAGAPQWRPATSTATNLNFQTLLVTSSFTRNDGTTAAVGEPLVNKRFLLERLNWLTYKGPSATSPGGTRNAVPTSAPAVGSADYDLWLLAGRFGLSSKFLQDQTLGGTATNILKYFGLSWDTTNERWNYVGHSGSTTPVASLTQLGTLTATREPDFFELLQAGIIDSSLGDSSSPDTTLLPVNHQQSKMLHVLTIGANLIAQSRADVYPVRIACTVATTVMEAVGASRLPYLNSVALCPVGGTGTSGGINWFLIPNLWNPFRDSWDLTETSVSSTLTPGYLRPPIRITVTGSGGNGSIAFGSVVNPGSVQPGIVPSTSATPFPTTISGINSSLTLATGPTTGNNFGRDGRLEAYRLSTSDFTSAPAAYVVTTSPTSATASWNNITRPPRPDSTQEGTTNLVAFRASLPGSGIPSTATATTTNPVIILRPGFQITLDYQSPTTASKWYSYSFLQGNNDTSTWISGSNGSNPPLSLTTIASQYGYNPGPPTGITPTILKAGTTSPWDMVTLAQAPMFAKADPRSMRYNSQIGVVNLASPPLAVVSAAIIGSIWPNPYTGPPSMTIGSTPTPTPTPTPTASPTPTPIATPNAPNPATLGDNAVAGNSANPYNELSGIAWRPVMMNRPFRSVGEMGYAFRDQPFRTLDFSSASSADAGLLDLFSVNDYTDPSSMRVGVVSLNAQQAPALAAVLGSTIKREDTPRVIASGIPSPAPLALTATEANGIAASLIALSGATPAMNKAGLAAMIANETGLGPSVPKTQRESIARALGEADQARTWNLMIDVIAQSGRYPPTATGVADLPKFIVEGEQRYWVHVAIDRFTGQVIDKQIEVVNE